MRNRLRFRGPQGRRFGTPLRYPGGKQRVAQFFAEVLGVNRLVGAHYAEPYAGGAGVAIELLLSGNVGHVHLNDCSQHIYSFWKIIKENPENLCRRISAAKLTVEEWRRNRAIVRDPNNHSVADIGFSTFYLNRCNRSGVLNGGLIGGLEQNGSWRMDARFPKKDLIARVRDIAERSDQISVTNLDAIDFVSAHAASHFPSDTLIYFDPPYYERADRLYYNSYKKEDHAKIAKAIQRLKHRNWIVSYDAHPEIMKHYAERTMFTYLLQYSASRAYKGREVFIFSDALMLPIRSQLRPISSALKKLIA